MDATRPESTDGAGRPILPLIGSVTEVHAASFPRESMHGAVAVLRLPSQGSERADTELI
jgi:hypothetical protein